MPAGMGHLARGALLFIGGSVVTVGTFLIAEDVGTFMIAFGPIIWGVIHICIGLFQSVSD
jgi:hypothetical protein